MQPPLLRFPKVLSLLPFTPCIFSSVSPSRPALLALPPCRETPGPGSQVTALFFPFCQVPGPHTTSRFPYPQTQVTVTRVIKSNLGPSFLFSKPIQDSPLLIVLKWAPLTFLASSLTTSWPSVVLLLLLFPQRSSPHPTSKPPTASLAQASSFTKPFVITQVTTSLPSWHSSFPNCPLNHLLHCLFVNKSIS